jgi:deoxyribonuclease V
LAALQRRLARAAADAPPWAPPGHPLFGGVFVAFAPAPGSAAVGAGLAGDRGWAAAVAWRPPAGPSGDPAGDGPPRRADRHLRGAGAARPRRADDVADQAVVCGRAPAPYVPGLLAAREGPLLAAALAALAVRPDVVLVDATGADHPRGAGLAVHLGAATGIPTVGVTRRPLLATGPEPGRRRGDRAPLTLGGRVVAVWVCTRTGTRPLVAHAGWRTDPDTAAAVVLAASTPAARTPVPIQEARRAAREARAAAVELGPWRANDAC